MHLPRVRRSRRGRIEIIPMIDVMFFLLATFMLASLSLQNLHSLPVDLPKGKASPIQAKSPVTLTVTREKALFVDSTPVTLDTLAQMLAPMMKSSNGNVIVAADSAAPHGIVTQAMIQARRAGAAHFLIAVHAHE